MIREYEAAQALENSLNDYTWEPNKFAAYIRNYHRTLQQTLIRTIVAVIKEVGSDEYPTDPRNQAAHDLCQRIVASGVLDEAILPFV